MSKILSISAVAHDCGIAYIEDGIIKYVFEEERFKRLKGIFNQFAFPHLSLEAFERETGITPFDKDVIVVMPKAVLCGLDYLESILEVKDIYLYDHHFSHACTAYFLSGFEEETLVFSYDGGDSNGIEEDVLNKDVLQKVRDQDLPNRETEIPEGEYIKVVSTAKSDSDLPMQLRILKKSWWFKEEHTLSSNRTSIHVGKNSQLELKYKTKGFDSVASLWNSFCVMNNMTGGKDEGKIVGLASQGKFSQEIFDSVGDFFKFDGDLRWKHYYTVESYFQSLDLKNPEIKKDAAYMIQYFTESYFLEVIQHLKSQYPSCKKLALAGGLFSNVKVNQRINELSEFDEIFIAPGMTDGGLALGAAIAKANELGEFKVRMIDNVFWGNKTEIPAIPNNVERVELNFHDIANYLDEGKVVGVFANRREWGPRALGGTSIMFDPRRNDAQEYVNRRLNRNEVMPFAPVVMQGFESIPFHCYKSKYASQFMTICYDVKDEWINRIPGVINTYDNTARIQIARKDNLPFFPILESFYEKTGIPLLMNTSFNVHGEPIINTSEQALNHLLEGVVDILIVQDRVYKLKSDTSIFDT